MPLPAWARIASKVRMNLLPELLLTLEASAGVLYE